MVYPTPTKRSPNSSEETSHTECSSEEWISDFLLKATLRPRFRSLPVLWMIVVSVIVFPIGMWSQLDSVSQAEEVQATNSDSAVAVIEAPAEVEAVESLSAVQAAEVPTGALPVLPDPTIAAAPSTRKMSVQLIEGGKVEEREIEVADGATIHDALNFLEVGLTKFDRVEPTPSTPVYHGQRIRVTRVKAETRTRTVEVAPSLRYRPTPALRPGQQKVENAGKPGAIEVSERVWFKDGKVSGREVLGKETVRAPQDKIIALGARPFYMPGKIPYHNRYASAYSLAARAGSPRDRIASHETQTLRPIKSMILTATGYSPHPSENGGYTVTATGLPISYGAAAVDPRVIPLGTKLYVEGYGYAFASDVGGAIKGNRIDLAYDSYRLANTKGRKKVKVWILAP